jgi:hypothetical protein
MVSTVAAEKQGPVPKATAAPSRTAWIDMARGLAEVSVVTFHILQAMNNAGLTPKGLFDFWTPVGDMIRMPLMMFVAGLFVEYSLRKGPKAYFTGKIQRVVWPYLVWAHVYSIYWYVKPSQFDSRTLNDVLLTVIDPGSHLWFLQSLMIYYVAVYFLLKRGLLTTFAVAVLMLAIIPFSTEDAEWLRRLPYLFCSSCSGVGFNRILRSKAFRSARCRLRADRAGDCLADPHQHRIRFLEIPPDRDPGLDRRRARLPAALTLPGLCAGGELGPEPVRHLLAGDLLRPCGVLVADTAGAGEGVPHGSVLADLPGLHHAGLFMPIVMALVLRALGVDVFFEWPKHCSAARSRSRQNF